LVGRGSTSAWSAPAACARRIALAALACCIALGPVVARADVAMPPGSGVFTGLTGGSAQAFASEVGKHPAVDGVFVTWGRTFESAFGQAHANHARLMLHISTAQGYGAPEQITPLAIAEGRGDGYLLSLGARIARSAEPVYIRLMPEMNQANNAYCAFNNSGSSRGASHSTASFRNAWRRAVLVLRGGPVATIDAHLHALGLPVLRGAQAAALPRPRVSFVWAPQTAGSPDTPSNSAEAYYPGDAYVDWVGTDFYSLFPNFTGLQRFYAEHPGKPFAFGEWALWNGDDAGWVSQLFAFIASHRRVRMALYNQGERSNGPFRLSRYPNARRAIRRLIASPRFLGFAPEWQGAAAHPARARVALLAGVRAAHAVGAGRSPKASARASLDRTPPAAYLNLAEAGAMRAERLWRDRRLGWYDERLGDRERFPLATIWDATPLFETLDAIALAAPSAAHRAALSQQVQKFLAWADRNFLAEDRLYSRTGSDPTPTPYIEGTLVEAHQVLCETGERSACGRAKELADASWQRFQDRLNMGPQFDTIYLHWMLAYAAQTGDGRWPALAREMAVRAQAHARDGRGLYLRAWDGTPITAHQAQPGMLQTDAATLELFAWLGAQAPATP
jgi:hypothetical protein